MYGFLDTNEASEMVRLPSEALMLNGVYIENLIPGYRTLHVQGREALSPDVESISTGVRSGSRLKRRRYPERIITVTYRLQAASNQAFRAAYNRLGQLLDVEDAQLVFRDEPDKYFTGTPCIIGNVKPGSNGVVGEIEFLCTDPFKYSLAEYEVVPEPWTDQILIDYNGTYHGYPKLIAEFSGEADHYGDIIGSGDSGFVSFTNENGKTIQLGDPLEVDNEVVYENSQTLVNSRFTNRDGWNEAAQERWVKNEYGDMGICAASYDGENIRDDGPLLDVVCKGKPAIRYRLYAKCFTKRGANLTRAALAVSAYMENENESFTQVLTVEVYINGRWIAIALKDSDTVWHGGTGYTKNTTIVLYDLPEDAASLWHPRLDQG